MCAKPRPEATSSRSRVFKLLQREILEARFGGAYQRDHLAFGSAIFVHRLVAFGDFGEAVGLGEARIDLAVEHQLVERVGLFVVGEVRALQALLAHPQVAQVGDRVVAGGAGADDDHAARVADEDGSGNGVFTGMLEDDARILALANDVPDGFAEGAAFRGPLVVRHGILPVRHHAPVQIFFPVDAALGAELHAEIDLAIVADDAHWDSAFGLDDLNRHAAEAARRAPNQHDVAAADDMWRPAHQHPVRGRADQRGACGFFPGEMGRLGHALMRLHAGELGEAAPVGFVTPDFEGRVVHRIVAVADGGRVAIPYAAVNDDAVADLDVVHVVAGRIDDTRGVAAADVEIRMIVLRFLARADHVDRRAEGRPHVVEIDPGGHDVDQHFVGLDFRDCDFFNFEGVIRVAETVRADNLRVHLLGHDADRRHLSDLVDFLMHHLVGYHRAPMFRDKGRMRLAPVL